MSEMAPPLLRCESCDGAMSPTSISNPSRDRFSLALLIYKYRLSHKNIVDSDRLSTPPGLLSYLKFTNHSASSLLFGLHPIALSLAGPSRLTPVFLALARDARACRCTRLRSRELV